MNKELIPKGRKSNIKRAYEQGLKDKEEEVLKKIDEKLYSFVKQCLILQSDAYKFKKELKKEMKNE